MAATEQVTRLDCWRQWNQCIEATAQILDGQLLVSTEYWEIKNWQPDEITFDSNDRSICVVESLRVDRRSEVVTATSVPKQPQPDSCRGYEKGPIVYHMVDGYKLQYK